MTGFQRFLIIQWLEFQISIGTAMCWFVGHRVVISPWHRSPNTVHTHWRSHNCPRCGLALVERAYFDVRRPDWPGEEP